MRNRIVHARERGEILLLPLDDPVVTQVKLIVKLIKKRTVII